MSTREFMLHLAVNHDAYTRYMNPATRPGLLAECGLAEADLDVPPSGPHPPPIYAHDPKPPPIYASSLR